MMTKHADRFISCLESLAGVRRDQTNVGNRQAIAALRRTLATWPAVPAEAVRQVAPFLHERATAWEETVHYLVAGLFALHPTSKQSDSEWGESFGTALFTAAGDGTQGTERRLLVLLNCKGEDLPVHLRQAITFLRSRNVAPDYRRLFSDLAQWDHPAGRVQKRWGRDYWSQASGTVESLIKDENKKGE